MVLSPVPDVMVTGVVSNSRQVQPGDLFVALSGGTADGHRYIPAALGRERAAVVGSNPLKGFPVPYVQVADSRLALAYLSAAFYGLPGPPADRDRRHRHGWQDHHLQPDLSRS